MTGRRWPLLARLAMVIVSMVGGCYFNIFSAHGMAIGITPVQEARDYVFSDPRR